MTRHRHRDQGHPAALAAALFGLLASAQVAAWLAAALWRLLPLALAAGMALALYQAGRRRRRAPARVGRAAAGTAGGDAVEVIRLRAENAGLRAELAEARQGARAAWQTASEPAAIPPAAAPLDMRGRLLADPRSGARPLGGAR